MSDYDHVQGGSLQLKGVGRVAKTSKNKKKKKALAERAAASAESPAATSASSSTAGGAAQRVDKRTDAERKFDELQKKREIERVMKKASIPHKQRVQEYNRSLEALTEHNDIPKVSWTK